MTGDLEQHWPLLAPLLDEALTLPQRDRERWLGEQQLEPGLQRLLVRLLDEDARHGAALESNLNRLREGADADLTPPPPMSIPGYRILHWLGSGGMASVFLAERQLDGASQRVALKLLRLNVHDPHERGLFQREQSALARLEHPHIARLIDAGFAADGAPWLAMEYVDGDTLLRFCDMRKLDLRARARLFLDVCAAVGAAHQALVVHRDLKPGNILVSSAGSVKLVDFGIAKLLESEEAATRTELRRLTPAYAAPEQQRGEDSGTASDIYALGVILTELLSGCRPLPRSDGSMPGLSTLPIDAATAAVRHADLGGLRRHLRGDLDSIVARAMRVEPRGRYVSVEALSADLTAWLEHRPVAARRGSRRYRLGKFLRRQRLALAVGGAFASALLVFSLTSLNLAREAQRAAAQARDEALRAQHVQDFVLGMFRGDESGLAQGKARSAEELVARALAGARREFADQPEALVPLLTSLGETERGLGHLETSSEVLIFASAQARSAFGPADPRTLAAAAELAHTRYRAGKYGEALSQLELAYAEYRGGGGVDNAATVSALTRLAMLSYMGEHPEDSIRHAAAAMSIAQRIFSPTHPQRLNAAATYGDSLSREGRYAEAAEVLDDNLRATRATYGPDHIITASALESLAAAYLAMDRPARALNLFEQAGDSIGRSVPEANVISAYVQNTWGVALLRLGQSEQAQKHFERALDLFHRLQGEIHPQVAATLDNLGAAALERGDYQGAAARWGKGAAVAHALGADQVSRASELDCSQGLALSLLGRHAEAAAAIARGRPTAVDPSGETALHCDAYAALNAAGHGDLEQAGRLAASVLAAHGALASDSIALQLAQAQRLAIGRHSANREDCERTASEALATEPPAYWPHFSARLWLAMADDAQACGAEQIAQRMRKRAAELAGPAME